MRAAGRIAWRSARRNLRHSALVVTMIALPLTVVTAAASVVRTSLAAPAEAAAWEAASVVAGALALFTTGLIAGAAFVVDTRRQLRQLGLVGAVGGARRHVMAVGLLGGTALGLVGSLTGAALGVTATFLLHPLLDDLVGHAVGPVRINLLVLLAAVAMGTGAATLAALAPARAAAKLGTVEALAGRSGPPRPPGRVAASGLVILLTGAVLTAWGTRTDDDLVQAGGFIGVLSGFLFLIPLLVAAVGRIASRLPLTARLAARDAARHGRRTGAAVAAAVIALAVPVAVSTYSSSVELFKHQALALQPNQLLIAQERPDQHRPAAGAAEPLIQKLRQEYAGGDVVALDPSVAGDLDMGQRYQALFVFTATEALSPAGVQRVREAADHAGVSVFDAEDYLPAYALARAAVTAASVPVALAIVAVAVALVVSESRRSRQLLAAVGASPGTHRRLLAATASLLALIAAVLAVPAGLVPLLLLRGSSGSDIPLVLPWSTFGLVLVVVPSLAALVSAVLARPPRPGALLRPA